MGTTQQSTDSPKPDKTQWRFRGESKAFLDDYFRNTNTNPKKKEKEQILAHLKEIGETEASHIRIVNWFNQRRRREKKRQPRPLLIPAPDSKEGKWMDVRHETLWPSLTRDSMINLQGLCNAYKGDPNKIPYDSWAEGLDAVPVHVRMWCKFNSPELGCTPRPVAAPVIEAQLTEEHSQLPTPGNSTSPEPPAASWLPLSPDTVKDELPVSPVVETTSPPGDPKEKTSMGLHEAIQVAFSSPPPPSVPQPGPSRVTSPNSQRKSSSKNSLKIFQAIPPPTPPLISPSNATTSVSTFLPPVPITSPPSPEPSAPSPLREPSPAPFLEGPTPGPSTAPDRDISHERATVVNGVAAKLEELNVIFNSAHGLAQFAGSIENMSRRNQQFLDDVSAGRFAHLRLTNEHVPNRQASGAMPEYNPLRLIAEWRDGKPKEKEKEGETDDKMQVG